MLIVRLLTLITLVFATTGITMGQFYTYLPQSTTNLLTNPSFETNTTGWQVDGTGTIARTATTGRQNHGAYGLTVTPGTGANDGVQTASGSAISVTSGTTYTFSVDVMSDSALNLQIWVSSTGGALQGSAVTFTTTPGVWGRHSVTYTESSTTTRLLNVTKVSGSATTAFYIDGAQFEALAYDTSFCDGDQPGCRWIGTPHASRSQRSVTTRSGGKKVDLQTYNAYLVSQQGTGMPPVKNIGKSFANADGSYYQRTYAQERPFTLAFSLSGDGVADWHSKRADLIDVIKPNATTIYMPMVIGYGDGGSDCEINAVYDGGLEMADGINDIEILPIRFIAHDPYWYRVGEKGAILDPQDSAAFYFLARRSDGTFFDANANSGNPGFAQRALAEGPDGIIYLAGSYTSSDANMKRIAKYDPATGTISALTTGAANGAIYALALGPDGTLYAGGSFTSIGGVAVTGIAKWNGSTWSSMGGSVTGGTATVFAIVVGNDGSVYIGGDFTAVNGVGATRLAKWNGSVWSNPFGTGANGNVRAMAVARQTGYIYFAGAHATLNGVTVNGVGYWNGTSFQAMSTGLNGINGWSIAVAPNGDIYAGGDFTTAGGIAVKDIAKWNGTSWSALGNVQWGTVFGLTFLQDGRLVASGDGLSYTTGSAFPSTMVAIWNGTVWTPINFAVSAATPTVYKVIEGSDGTLYFAMDSTNNVLLAGTPSSITNDDASADCYPTIVVTGPSSGTANLYEMQNFTTGDALYFNSTVINAGETITITTKPGQKSIISSLRGSILNELMPGSDLGIWHLASGTNSVNFYASSTSVAVRLYWRERNWTIDNGTP